MTSGSAEYIITELGHIYEMAKISMEKFKNFAWVKQKFDITGSELGCTVVDLVY